MTEVLLLGSLTRDALRLPGARWTQPGGSPWHAGLALAAAGADTAVVARAGPWARAFGAPALHAAGATVLLAPGASDTAFLNDYRGDRRWQWLRSVGAPLAAADLPPELPQAAAVAVSPLLADVVAREAVSRVVGAGGFVGLDVQGLLRRVGVGGRIETVARDVSAWAAGMQALKFSAREFAVVFAGQAEDEAAALARSLRVEVIVTQGGDGALVAAPGGGVTTRAGPARVGGAADTTGGGDIFLAGYVRARARGAGVGAALDEAITLAGAVVSRRAGLLAADDAIVAALRSLHATALWAWRRSLVDVRGAPSLFAGDTPAALAVAARFPRPLLPGTVDPEGPGVRGPAWVGAAWALASLGWPVDGGGELGASSMQRWAQLERWRARRVRAALLA